MAKRRKGNRKIASARSKAKVIVPTSWTWQWHLAAILGLLALITWLYHPMILSGMLYPTGDTIDRIVLNHQIMEYMRVTGETVQWNPFPWGGIPNIFSLPRSVFSPDFYLHVLSDLLTFPLVFSMLGGLGMYLLLRYLQHDMLLSFFGAALFLLLPFQKSMIIAGHFSKYEATMYIPWIILGVKAMLDKSKLAHVLGLALVLALQLRAGHYQVSFYSGVLVVALLLVPIWRAYKDVHWQSALKSLSLFVITAGCALLLAAQPLLIAGKFAAESVRGSQVERLDVADDSNMSSGIAKDLVSEWSFSPAEMLSVLVPHAVGGTSDHRLSPAQARRFRQKVIGTYWGPSPFNTSFYYLGVLPLLLLLFGFLSKPSRLQKSLLAVLILMLIWAMGTNAEPFYSLCYSVLPFFKNFRTPTSSFTMVNAILPILAVYGIQSLKSLAAEKQYAEQKQRFRKMLWIVGGMIFFIVLLGSILSFEKSGQNIANDALQLVREIRQGLYYGDAVRLALLSLTAVGIFGLVMKRKMSILAATWVFVMLTIVDLGYQNTRYGTNPISSGSFHDKYLTSTSTIDFLKEDAALFRVEPFASGNLGLPRHVQTIGGGLDLQMNRYAYEVYYNNLHHKLDGNLPMNWNVLDALNVKYIVSDQQIDHPNVRLEHTDLTGKYVYRYKFNVDRGYFVDGYRVIADDRERLEALNDTNLDLRRTALLESMPVQKIQPASRSKVDLVSYGLDHVTYTVEADVDGLFVLSELYAPASQQVYLDGDPVSEVYKTNHLVQSITVPRGLHTIELRYESDWYALSALISKVAFMLLLILGGIWAYRNWKQVPGTQ